MPTRLILQKPVTVVLIVVVSMVTFATAVQLAVEILSAHVSGYEVQ